MHLTCSTIRISTRTVCFRRPWIRDPRGVNSIFFRNVTSEASENASADFVQQLEDMKSRFLPTEEGLWDKFNIQALRKSLQSHLSLPHFRYPSHVPPGYHQVCFNSLPY